MSYKKSIFNISPAVEVAYDLHLTAALMRACVACDRKESSLLSDAKAFRAKLTQDSDEVWKDNVSLRSLMEDKSLRAPSTSKQRSGTSEELSAARHVPISANMALVTDFVRNTTNLWAVGERMALMVRRGAPSRDDYEKLMEQIVADDDECWSGFVNFKIKELVSRSDFSPEIKQRLSVGERSPLNLETNVAREDADLRSILYPGAPELYASISALVELKRGLLSSHFVALLDSLLRLHAFSEVRRLSLANAQLLEMALVADEQTITEDQIREKLSVGSIHFALSSEADLNEEIENLANLLERARLFFGAFSEDYDIAAKVSSVAAISRWFAAARAGDAAFTEVKNKFVSDFQSGSHASQIKGSAALKNFKEFMKYVVQQRVVDTGLDGQFDQGYWAQKTGPHKSAPWKMRISPVGSLLFAGLACRGLPSCTFSEIAERMLKAGLHVSTSGRQQLYNNLKSLGLTIDSPDGIGGFVVNNPFRT